MKGETSRQMKGEKGVTTIDGEWLVNKLLRRGIRKALRGPHGKLLRDPKDFLIQLGTLIDLELQEMARIRKRHANREQRPRVADLFAQAEKYFKPINCDCRPASGPFKKIATAEPRIA